jgi:hypothetical protein
MTRVRARAKMMTRSIRVLRRKRGGFMASFLVVEIGLYVQFKRNPA